VSVRVGDVLHDAFAGYRALWRYLGRLSLALTAIVVLVALLLVAAMGTVGVYMAVVLSVVGAFWITALLVQTIDDLADDDAETGFEARFDRFSPRLARVSAVALLLGLVFLPGWLLVAKGHTALGVLLGLFGLVAAVWLALMIPLIVIEDYGIDDAFEESKELVAGNALKVFGALLVTGFLTGVVGSLIERLALSLTDSWVFTLVASGLFDALATTSLTALVLVEVYRALRHGAPGSTAVPAAAG
jgi:hypothetical protein